MIYCKKDVNFSNVSHLKIKSIVCYFPLLQRGQMVFLVKHLSIILKSVNISYTLEGVKTIHHVACCWLAQWFQIQKSVFWVEYSYISDIYLIKIWSLIRKLIGISRRGKAKKNSHCSDHVTVFAYHSPPSAHLQLQQLSVAAPGLPLFNCISAKIHHSVTRWTQHHFMASFHCYSDP